MKNDEKLRYYSDAENAKGAYFLFVGLQVVLLLVVYAFVYTSLVAVKLAIAKYHLPVMAYLPVVFVLFGYPVVLYKTRLMFRKEKRLRATGWMLGWAAVFIVFLYAFVVQLVGS